jgi:hypothetical protein
MRLVEHVLTAPMTTTAPTVTPKVQVG